METTSGSNGLWREERAADVLQLLHAGKIEILRLRQHQIRALVPRSLDLEFTLHLSLKPAVTRLMCSVRWRICSALMPWCQHPLGLTCWTAADLCCRQVVVFGCKLRIGTLPTQLWVLPPALAVPSTSAAITCALPLQTDFGRWPEQVRRESVLASKK